MFNRKTVIAALAERLHECADDELRVIDRVLDGIEKGRAEYGPLDVLRDGRNWRQESAMEMRDWLFYDAAHEVARDARERERIVSADRVLAGLRELRVANDNELACSCGHGLDEHRYGYPGKPCMASECHCLVFRRRDS